VVVGVDVVEEELLRPKHKTEGRFTVFLVGVFTGAKVVLAPSLTARRYEELFRGRFYV